MKYNNVETKSLIPNMRQLTYCEILDYSLIRMSMALVVDFEEYKRFSQSNFSYGIKNKIATKNSLFFLERWIASVANLVELIMKDFSFLFSNELKEMDGYSISFTMKQYKETDKTFIATLKNIRNKYTHKINSEKDFIRKHLILLLFENRIISDCMILQRDLVSRIIEYLDEKYDESLFIPNEFRNLLIDNWSAWGKIQVEKNARHLLVDYESS